MNDEDKNPHNNVYLLNPNASPLDLHDAIDERLAKSISLISATFENETEGFNNSDVINYFWTIGTLLKEIKFFYGEMWERLKKEKFVNQEN